MRKIISSLVLFLIVFSSKGQNVGINTNTPHPSAALDISDSTKGILIPRMTITQRNSIQNPAEGLVVYQTDSTKGYWSFDGQKWKHMTNIDGTSQGDMLYWNGSNWVTVPAGQYGQGLFFCNGVPSWGGCLPLISTSSISDTTAYSATSGGIISTDGGSPVNIRGIVWDTLPNPTTLLTTKTNDGIGVGSFISNISNLLPNKMYYVRSYAINDKGVAYGNQVSFFSKVALPTVFTYPASSITYNSTRLSGNVYSDGGSILLSKGICYSMNPLPEISNSNVIISSDVDTGEYYFNVTDLLPNTTYYARSFANNIAGTIYGNVVTWSTFQLPYAQSCNSFVSITSPQMGTQGFISANIGDTLELFMGRFNTPMMNCYASGFSNPQNTIIIESSCSGDGISEKIKYNQAGTYAIQGRTGDGIGMASCTIYISVY
jgi:hypothetical protein